jgi:hypothetical protein
VENDSSGDAQVVLTLRSQAKFVEAGHQIIHLQRANGETVRDFEVHSAVDGHGERIVRTGESKPVMAADMRDAKKRLAGRSDPRMMTIGNASGREAAIRNCKFVLSKEMWSEPRKLQDQSVKWFFTKIYTKVWELF